MNKIISFGIYANQTDKRWNTFIEEMNDIGIGNTNGNINAYYGIDKYGVFECHFNKNSFQTIITLDDYFAEGSVYRVVSKANWDELEGAGLDKKLESWDDKPTFKRGERILVWDRKEVNAIERLGFEYLKDFEYPVLVVSIAYEKEFEDKKKVSTEFYKHWKPLSNERQKLQQEIEQLEKELNVKRLPFVGDFGAINFQ